MRLTKLEIYGFKSFARRTEILFPQNVTGIVGPNGSGKSNIGDAVRWVLGEQSAKILRGNSMADVIFNGTETRKALNYCEVTLTFDNSDHQLSVAFEEVSVTRRVYRSGDSEYLLNGAACRLKDIIDLFRDTGVGKEGYSIIGQGRIDEILSQRSEDRRAVFEEAAGISRYRSRKEEAENRLKKADENLVRVLDVLEELEKRLEPLRVQAEVAKEYQALSETLRELDVRLYLLRNERLKKREAAADQALLQIAAVVREAEEALAEATSRRDAAMTAQEALSQALNEAHDLLLARTDQLHQAKEAVANAVNRVNNASEAKERLQAERGSYANRLRLIEATLQQSGQGSAETDRILAEAEKALEERKILHAQITEKADKLEQELTEQKNRIMERMNQMQTMRTSQARQSAMQQQMNARKQEIEAQLAQEESRGEGLAQALSLAQESLSAEEARLQELKEGYSNFEKSTEALLSQILSEQRKMQDELQSARSVESRYKTLKELRDGFEGYQYPVKNALNYAKHTHAEGVRGVVATLLHVPEQYETAIDMVLGAAMQNIVTDTEQEAKTLIDFLRTNKLGRATFLPVSTVRSHTLNASERRYLTMPGCLGVASELCTFDEKYRGIIENLLGRTVIAENLDKGIAIMKAAGHSFRLVTLQGDVMHSGGSMSGGSVQQKTVNLLSREREIGELEEKLKSMTDSITAAQAHIAQMETERAGEKERREAAQYDLHQQEIAVVRDAEHLKSAQADVDAHGEKLQNLRDAIAQLEEGLQSIGEELQRIEALTQQEETDSETMNERTVSLSAELDQARRERENSQEMLTDAMLTLQNARNESERMRQDRERLEQDAQTCREELEKLRLRIEENTQETADAQSAKDSAETEAETCDKQVTAAHEQVDLLEGRSVQKQKELREIQADIDAAQQQTIHETDRQHRQELTLNRIRGDITQLNDRLWNTHELTYQGAVEAEAEYEARRAEAGTPEEAFDENAADSQAQQIRDRIRQMGTVNVGAVEEYAEQSERYSELSAQKDDLLSAKQDLETLIAQLLQKMETVFVGQFSELQRYFSETFTRLFGGGCGEISLSDPKDPLNCGIEIIVQPPGKKRQILSLFSGGERALTAIAILFAMLKLKPTPFCILDEIEAALDDANISYFADYLKEFSKDTQFIVVTHRKGTMERCDTLFGVAMEERGVSSMVSVNLTDYAE